MILDAVRRLIYGRPIPTHERESTLLSKVLALPVFCSDAISSVAYGNQQIVLALCLAGFWLPQYSSIFSHHIAQVSCLIAAVLVLVALSYWQTIHAYPRGGGSYIVTKDNLGTNLGLIAGAAILIDYVLCVSVSVASGLQNLRDVPVLSRLNIGEHMVPYCLGVILLMTILNLRGLREPGALFAIPFYTFVGMSCLMIALGLFGDAYGYQYHREFANQVIPPGVAPGTAATTAIVAVLLRAFAMGCSALTGVEAVADGVPAFRDPKSHNAAITLVWMAVILGTIFTGVSLLAIKFHIVYWEHGGVSCPALIDQLSGTVFGKTGGLGWAYTLTQFATALILMIAAQTSYSDFPRVCSFLARDGFMPRQLANVGDRLAFDNGIMILGFISAIFIVAKKGSVDLLIPFFTIGVFLAFTLSQCAMVRHWFIQRQKGWQVKALFNGIGATATFVVLVDIAIEKFVEGAWFVMLLMGILLFIFQKVHSHYVSVAEQLVLTKLVAPRCIRNKVVILVQSLHAGTLKFIEYARAIEHDCEALYVEIEPEWTTTLEEDWRRYVPDIPLVIVKSPYRSLVGPIMDRLDQLHDEDKERTITVIVGEFVSTRWWHSLLHGNTGLILKLAFLGRRDVVVTNVRYWLSE